MGGSSHKRGQRSVRPDKGSGDARGSVHRRVWPGWGPFIAVKSSECDDLIEGVQDMPDVTESDHFDQSFARGGLDCLGGDIVGPS